MLTLVTEIHTKNQKPPPFEPVTLSGCLSLSSELYIHMKQDNQGCLSRALEENAQAGQMALERSLPFLNFRNTLSL